MAEWSGFCRDRESVDDEREARQSNTRHMSGYQKHHRTDDPLPHLLPKERHPHVVPELRAVGLHRGRHSVLDQRRVVVLVVLLCGAMTRG